MLWLFKAEGISPCIEEACWGSLSAMGQGVEKGIDKIGIEY